MTDNRTTELLRELRKMLDLCRRTEAAGFETYWITAVALDSSLDELEQAIAATLGSDDEYEAKMDELLCYLTNGKFSKSRQYSLDFMKACVDEEYEDAYNELNAKLGSGTCEVECFDDGTDEGMDGEWFSYAPPTWYLSCGHTAQGTEPPNFCPNCGRQVKR